MPRSASARRYAQAVFQIALERDELDAWMDDLTLLAHSLDERELAGYLDAPQVAVDRKIDVIRITLGDSAAPLAVNLLCLLASRGITTLTAEIADQYQRMVDAHRGVERAEVVSAVPLDQRQRRRVTEMLEGVVGREVQVDVRVDPGIGGGLMARVGDRLLDGSTKTKIEEMRRELVERV